jgi:hypothetical protein
MPSVSAPFAIAVSATPTVRTDHPRIFMTPERLVALRALAAADDPDFVYVRGFAQRRLDDALATKESELEGSYPDTRCNTLSLSAAVGQEPAHVAEAKWNLASLASVPTDNGGDTGWRNRAYSLALGYDWLFHLLTPAERQAILDTMWANFERSVGTFTEPAMVGGHDVWANKCSLLVALAVHGEEPRIDAYFDQLWDNFIHRATPFYEWLGAEGGSHMGWAYGTSYNRPEGLLAIASATDRDFWPSYTRNFGYFMLYAANQDAEFPTFGDTYSRSLSSPLVDLVATSAQRGPNGHAEKLYRELRAREFGPGIWEPYTMLRFIINDGAVAAEDYGSLPLARDFGNSGFVIARDRWDRAEGTTTVFKCAPFYSINHHHRDDNSFYVDYRGPLLIDSGYYDAYGSDHWTGFYIRTVAHNSLLVDWPEEPQRSGYPNDGGQLIPASWAGEPSLLDDVLGTWPNPLVGRTGFAQTSRAVWVRGDASRAYYPEKLTSFNRDLVIAQLPSEWAHPFMLVLDRIELPVARQSRILWQLTQAPALSATSCATFSNPGGGHGRLDFLGPAGLRVDTVSGSQRWVVDGVDHPPTAEAGQSSPQWGRIQVSAPLSTSITYKTVLIIDDQAISTSRLPLAQGLSGAGWEGAIVGGSLLAVATDAIASIAVPSPAGDGISEAFVGGLGPSQSLQLSLGGQAPRTIVADADGLATTD